MQTIWVLAGTGGQAQRLRYRHGAGAPRTTVSPVLTVGDVCRRLRKSRRQVYRYLRDARLQPCAQILGQWLFAPEELRRFARDRVPRTLQWLFWDARVAALSTTSHHEYILGRLLQWGDRPALQWLFHAYPRDVMARFLQGRGRDVLDARTWQFWAQYLGVPGDTRGHLPVARARGRAWGGLP